MTALEQNRTFTADGNYNHNGSYHFFGDIYKLFISDLRLPLIILRDLKNSSIDELTESVRQHGLLNPIVVRATSENKFEIIAGCRRFLACKNLKWRKIQCHVMHLNDVQARGFDH